MSEDSMVERVARAQYEDAGQQSVDEGGERGWPWEQQLAIVKDLWRRRARVGIAALREPTEAMREAGHEASLAEGAHDCEVPMADVYRAMIDSALSSL